MFPYKSQRRPSSQWTESFEQRATGAAALCPKAQKGRKLTLAFVHVELLSILWPQANFCTQSHSPRKVLIDHLYKRTRRKETSLPGLLRNKSRSEHKTESAAHASQDAPCPALLHPARRQGALHCRVNAAPTGVRTGAQRDGPAVNQVVSPGHGLHNADPVLPGIELSAPRAL